jgi:hypothetical protein
MSHERESDPCATQRENLLWQMYGDASTMPAELRAHLATCAACRAALESSQRMSAALRTALRPEALSAQAVQTLQQRLSAEPARRWLARPYLHRLVETAVAAGLVAALILPWWWHRSGSRDQQGSPRRGITLSSEDAATILAAYTCVGWDGTTDTALRLLADEVSGVSRTLQREAGTETYLPWNRENDWDLPAEDRGALRGPAPAPLYRGAGGA